MNNQVRRYLIEKARDRRNPTITYQRLSDECGLGLNMQDGQHIRNEIGRILGDISRFEHSHDRPLLSALVTRVGDDDEGDGFYKLAEELGFGNWRRLRSNMFSAMQITECVNFWSNPDNYENFR